MSKALNSVGLHRRDEPGVMHLHSRNGMFYDDPFPLGINCGSVGEKRQQALDLIHLSQGRSDRKAEAVLLHRASPHIPNSSMFWSEKSTGAPFGSSPETAAN